MFIYNVPAPAACVLHNICEIHHDQFNDAWLVDDKMALHNQTHQYLRMLMPPIADPVKYKHWSPTLLQIDSNVLFVLMHCD